MEQDHSSDKAAEMAEFFSKHCHPEMSHPSHIPCLADHLGLVHWHPPALPPFCLQEGVISYFHPGPILYALQLSAALNEEEGHFLFQSWQMRQLKCFTPSCLRVPARVSSCAAQ